jgi:hypothetical protein
MTLNKPVPGRGRAEQSQVRPRVQLFADFRRGVSDAISGQKLEVVRASNEPLQASNGVFYSAGANIPNLGYTPNGIGLTGSALYSYEINPQIRLSGQPLVPYQIAWHGLLPAGLPSGRVIWAIGGTTSANRLVLSVFDTGVGALYANNANETTFVSIPNITAQQEVFVVVQMVPDGAENVQVRLAVKRRVAFDDPPWDFSGLSTSRLCGLSYNTNKIGINRISGDAAADDLVTYRIFVQNGTVDVDDLAWDWEARRDGLPGVYGLIDDTTFIYPELGAPTDLFFQDDPSYIFINPAAPSDYLLTEPGGIASPYLTLEPIT